VLNNVKYFSAFLFSVFWGWVFYVVVDIPGHGWQIAGLDIGTMVENDDALLALYIHQMVLFSDFFSLLDRRALYP